MSDQEILVDEITELFDSFYYDNEKEFNNRYETWIERRDGRITHEPYWYSNNFVEPPVVLEEAYQDINYVDWDYDDLI